MNHQEKVYNILLTPVICDKSCPDIHLDVGKIYSGQKYHNKADADMSDFSIGFYEVLYKDILKGQSLLDNQGNLTNKYFAGDTINSFQSIANITPDAGGSKAERTNIVLWPQYLQEYYTSYHCLANFWLIPMKIGRTGTKLNKYDAVDIFLSRLKDEYKNFSIKSPYFNNFTDFQDFCGIHFVKLKFSEQDIIKMYKDRKSKELVQVASDFIKQRAKNISTSKYMEDLYNYFSKFGLC